MTAIDFKARFSQRIQQVQTPIIPQVGEWVRQNPGTLSLGQGVSYYGPPKESYDAVEQHLHDQDIYRYGPVEGIPELRQALRDKLETQNGIAPDEQTDIVVTAGSNMAFNTIVLALGDTDDEFILPIPYYFNHEMAITMAGCKPVLVDTLEDYHLDLDALKAAITSKTKAIVTVSPNNPTGAVYTKEELVAVNQLCKKHGIYHISDEAYEDFTYGDHEHFSPATLENSQKHTISLFSFSKAYGFAGWRIGYMLIPQHLKASVKKIQDTILISPTMISQYAAIGALQAGPQFIHEKLKPLREIRDEIVTALNEIQTIESTHAEGAFYAFIKLRSDQNDLELVQQLVQSHGIAMIPGSAFGTHDGCFLRISYGALEQKDLSEAINRLKQGLSSVS